MCSRPTTAGNAENLADRCNARIKKLERFCKSAAPPFTTARGAGHRFMPVNSFHWRGKTPAIFDRFREPLCQPYSRENASPNQTVGEGSTITRGKIRLGKRLPWGRQGENHSSMLRNKAQGKVWQFGITALPGLWPYPHFKLKSRVLFADIDGDKAGPIFADKDLQHRFQLR